MQFSSIKSQIKNKAQNSQIADSDLNIWVNNGYHEIINAVVRTAEDYFGNSTTYSISPNTRLYTLPDDFKKSIKVVDENDNPLKRVDFMRAADTVVGYFLWGNQIGFMLMPQSSVTYTHYYIYNPSDLSADSDKPQIDNSYHHLFIVWGLKEYYESQQDLEYSGYYYKEFQVGLTALTQELDSRDLQPKSVSSGNPETDVHEWLG